VEREAHGLRFHRDRHPPRRLRDGRRGRAACRGRERPLHASGPRPGGAAGTPLAFAKIAARLVGTKLEDKAIEDAASDASKETDPGADLHATKEYRRHLARVLAGRVLREAREKAKLQ